MSRPQPKCYQHQPKNVIKQRGYFGRLRRCTQADAIAGIGLSPPDEDPSPGDETMFSVAYALAVPSVCPHLKVDEDAAKERAEEGKNAWAKSIPDHNASQLDADSILRFQEKEARKAIETDAKELPSFCARVLSAFGENGRVIPGLIVSKKKAEALTVDKYTAPSVPRTEGPAHLRGQRERARPGTVKFA